MAVNISIYNQGLKDKFLEGLGLENPGALPEGHEKYIEVVPSDQRIEVYPFMSASPGIQEYMGKRRLTEVAPTNYEVTNRDYDAGFSVLWNDLMDDKAEGYQKIALGLGQRAKMFPVEKCMRTIASGASTLCFDGTNFFADSHTVGTGDNSITYNGSRNNGTTHYVIGLITDDFIKPLLWQNRQEPELFDNYSETESRFRKSVNYWMELRGAVVLGPWWNAVLVTVTDTPYPFEAEEIISSIIAAFKGFSMPKALATDDTQYFHGGKLLNASNFTVMVPPACEFAFLKAAEGGMLATSGGAAADSIYKGKFNLAVNPFLS